MDSRRPPFDPKVSNHLELVEGYFKIERESSILRTMNGLARENRGQSFDSHDLGSTRGKVGNEINAGNVREMFRPRDVDINLAELETGPKPE